MADPLGLITRGSLSQGLQLKLEPGCSVENMRVGRFVVIEGRENRFFCLVTDMELGVCINLERLVERSNGVFGKSGTGKSFLTRLLLSGVICADVASALVFDMHSEYGWETASEEGGSAGTVLPGLRRLFGARVHVYALDRESSAARGVQVDGYLDIGLNGIEIEDIALLQEELGLSSAMIDTCYILQRQFGEGWLRTLLETEPESLKNMAAMAAGHEASVAALYRKLARLRAYAFVKDHLAPGHGGMDEMMGWLERGEHVVLEF